MTAKRRWPWAALLALSTLALVAVMLSWRAPGPAVAGTVPTGDASRAKVMADGPIVRFARMSPVATHAAGTDRLPRRVTVAPVSIRIDALGVDTGVTAVGVDPATGGMAVPPDGGVIGWYQYGPSPGEEGSAVLAGHVDYGGRPGAFFNLRTLEPGAVVVVRDVNGAERSFVVQGRAEIAKPELPVAELFSRSGPPALLLITCGGSFDRAARSYAANVVVYAVPA
jgi:Sortase domain